MYDTATEVHSVTFGNFLLIMNTNICNKLWIHYLFFMLSNMMQALSTQYINLRVALVGSVTPNSRVTVVVVLAQNRGRLSVFQLGWEKGRVQKKLDTI